jgi:hypothetical protein
MSSLKSLVQMDDRSIVGLIRDGGLSTDPKEIARAKLVFDLVQAGVRPFTNESVDAYQKKKNAFWDGLSHYVEAIADPSWALTSVFAIGIGVLGGAGVCIMSILQTGGELSTGDLLLAAGYAVVVFSLCMVLRAVCGWADRNMVIKYSKWQTASYDSYSMALDLTPVPQRGVDIIKKVLKARPDVRVDVEYFKLDPFVKVTHKDYSDVYYRVFAFHERGYRETRV